MNGWKQNFLLSGHPFTERRSKPFPDILRKGIWEVTLAVKIRLKRFGSKNRDQWRIVVAEAKMPRDGRFIEEIGHYDPLPANEVIVVKSDRFKYWVSKGAQVSPSVKSLVKRAEKKTKKAAEPEKKKK